MTRKPKKGDFKELKIKKTLILGKPALGLSRSLHLWPSFRKAVSIYPGSMPEDQHYPDSDSKVSSAWIFCACFSNIFFTKKPVVVLQNVGWFLRLILSRRFGDPYRKARD